MKSIITRNLLAGLLAISMSTSFALAQTYIVTTIDDSIDDTDNVLSLREAIAASNANDVDGDIILFDNSLTGQTISLVLGEMRIEDDLTIGNEATPLPISIDASGASRIFSVATQNATGGRAVAFFDISFLNGMEVDGGALMIGEGEEVNCVRCLFEGNTATGDTPGQGGGAIFNAGALSLMYTNVINNSAVTGAGNGGGILIAPTGTLTMAAGTIEANVANRAGGGVENNGGVASFEGMLFSKNIAGPDSTSAAPGNGGAIHVSGMGTTNIKGGVAVGNLAFSEGGAFWNGAGVMTVDGVTIGGRATGEPNVASGSSADNGGGGLFNNGGTLNVTNATLIANMANGASGSGGGILSDGGILSVSASALLWNDASRAGGGIESTSGAALTLQDVDFSQNTTGPSPGNGAAVHVTGTGNTMIFGGMVTTNSAASEGGGFWNGAGTMTIEGTQIGGTNPVDANIASGDGADNGGGGVFNNGGTMIIRNAWIEGNSADGASGSGGGVLNDGGKLFMEMSVVKGNTANRAGGGIESNGAPDADGTLRATTDSLTFVTLQDNIAGTAPGNGGGFHLTGPGNVLFEQSVAVNNEAGNEGGGLWNSGAGAMTLRNATVSGNTAPKGGGLFQQAGDNSSFQTWFVTVAQNTASTSGGGFQSDGGLPALYNTILAENQMNGSASDCAGMFASMGFNLIQSLDGCMPATINTDITGMPAMLADLADNGGPTATHGLMTGSPAINAGECAGVMVDQRGASRMAPCDIGAFESVDMPDNSGITFTLINAVTDMPVAGFDPIPNGANIMRSMLPAEVSVRANVPGNPGSVAFTFNAEAAFRIEHAAPYALFGDVEGDYKSQPVQDGIQRITATPYTQPMGQGQALPAGSVSFTVVNASNVVTQFVLVDADTDQDVMVLEDNIMISVSDLPVNLNVRAETGAGTKSVVFSVGENSRSEVVAPFALFGDIAGDYLNGAVPPGTYVLTATPYDGAPEQSQAGMSLSIRAIVTDGSGNISSEGEMWLPANESVILSNDESTVPDEFVLSQNYPNPFNPTTSFSFSVPDAAQVQLVVFNLLGQRVQTLVDGVIASGTHQISFDAADLPSGIYLYRLETPQGTFTRKMILAK